MISHHWMYTFEEIQIIYKRGSSYHSTHLILQKLYDTNENDNLDHFSILLQSHQWWATPRIQSRRRWVDIFANRKFICKQLADFECEFIINLFFLKLSFSVMAIVRFERHTKTTRTKMLRTGPRALDSLLILERDEHSAWDYSYAIDTRNSSNMVITQLK